MLRPTGNCILEHDPGRAAVFLFFLQSRLDTQLLVYTGAHVYTRPFANLRDRKRGGGRSERASGANTGGRTTRNAVRQMAITTRQNPNFHGEFYSAGSHRERLARSRRRVEGFGIWRRPAATKPRANFKVPSCANDAVVQARTRLLDRPVRGENPLAG